MNKQVQRGDIFNLPNSERGKELLAGLMRSHDHANIPFRVAQEKITVDGLTFTLLTLETLGKRPGEGQIAQAMKESRR